MRRTTMVMVTGVILLAAGKARGQPAGNAAAPRPQSPTMMGSGVAQYALAPQPRPAAITPSGELAPAAGTTSSAPLSAEDSRILLRVTLGAAAVRLTSQYDDRAGATATAAELGVDVGARLSELFAIGGHAGIVAGLSWEESYWHDIDDEVVYYGVGATPMELGAAVHFFPSDRVWISPWAGLATLGRAGGTQGAIGISGGVDLMKSDLGHRLGLYAQGLRTSGYSDGDDGLRSFSLGATYSFR